MKIPFQDKINQAITNTIKKVSPEVQKEIKSVVNKTTSKMGKNALQIATVGALLIGVFYTSSKKPHLSPVELEEAGRSIYFVYNEVRTTNTYNYYSKGEVK